MGASDVAPDRETYDVVIVGGGHNGLTAAAYLAGAGLSTLVLERLDHTGGAAVSTEAFPARVPGCRATPTWSACSPSRSSTISAFPWSCVRVVRRPTLRRFATATTWVCSWNDPRARPPLSPSGH
ncbi:MAG: FAD-dependent oxidoreductase [Marmoricola sp.]